MGAVTLTVNLAGAEVEEQRDDDNAIGRRSPGERLAGSWSEEQTACSRLPNVMEERR